MFDYYVKDFDIDNIIPAIESYEQKEAHRIKRAFNYYNGKQDIENKETAEGRPNNKVVSNYCKEICDTYLGFINPVGMTTNDAYLEEFLPEVQDAVKDTIITGVGYLYAYYDERPVLRRLYPDKAMIIRDTTVSHNVIGGAFWNYYEVFEKGHTVTYIDLYVVDSTALYYYTGTTLRGVTLEDTWSHNIKGIPLVEMRITSHYDSVIDPIYSLQDLVNVTLSSYADGRSSFSDAFLMITGMGIEEDTANGLIDGEHKILNLPLPDCDAKYLLKEDSGSDIVTLLSDIDDRIYRSCSLPKASGTETNGSLSGAAIIAKYIKTFKVCNGYRGSIDISLQRLADATSHFTYEWPEYLEELADAEEDADNAVSQVREAE